MKLLKKNKWLEADSLCIAQGSAVAMNLMFETKNEHEIFFKLWDKYLGDMTEIIHYHLSPTTWTVLFKTKSVIDIERVYLNQRGKSKKAKKEHTLKQAKKMISEHFRIFISQFVRKTNLALRRKGTKVMHRFKKCILDGTSEYKKFFHLLTEKTSINPQSNPKYRADERAYDVQKEMVEQSILKSGNAYYEASKEGEIRRVVKEMRFIHPNNSVLRKLLNSNKNSKFHPPPPKI